VRLLLDEMLSPVIARELRARGHDVTAIKEFPGHESLGDLEVMDLARGERRGIATDNLRDYRPLHHAAVTPGGEGHYGMVFMPGGYRRTKKDVGRIVTALEAILIGHPGENDLANAEAWL
jgi:hypothetical protein